MEEQKHLFTIIKTGISDNQRLADVVEEILGKSSNSVYRRIRGETELSFSELLKICNHFNLSIDEIMNYRSGSGALFHYNPLRYSDQESYISQMKRMLDILNVLKSSSDKEIIYTAQSIPFYHLVAQPELACLNLFVWSKALKRLDVSYETFYQNLDKAEILSMYQKIHQAYMAIPSKEIWTIHTIGSLLRQLEYFWETGTFERKDTVLLLLNQLTALMDTIHRYADSGLKGSKLQVPFSMYNCSVDLDNNSMIARKENRLFLFIRLHTVNFIETDSEDLCHATVQWNNGLISKSTLISGESSAKQRTRFFRRIKDKIEEVANKIK